MLDIERVAVNVIGVDVELKAAVTTLAATVTPVDSLGIGRYGGLGTRNLGEHGVPLDGLHPGLVVGPDGAQSSGGKL